MRLAPALLLIEFLVIIKVHAAKGWSPSAGGAEYVVFWALILLAILPADEPVAA